MTDFEAIAATADGIIVSCRDNLCWIREILTYQCWFGEIPLFKLRMPGLKACPNVFETPVQTPSPPANKKRIPAFVYSLPCPEEQKTGFLRVDGYHAHVTSVYRHYYVNTSTDFDTYRKHFSSKSLNGMKRKIKKIESTNTKTETLRCYRRPEEIDEFIETAKGISRLTYQERHLGMVLPTSREFREKLTRLAADGKFYGFILNFENRPIAYTLCPVYGNGILLYDYTGYDPDYSKYSPGSVLQFKIIEIAFVAPDISIYDLCTGEGRHKSELATGYINCCDVFYLPATHFHLALIHLRIYIEALGSSIVRFLERLGVKEKVKKFMRKIY